MNETELHPPGTSTDGDAPRLPGPSVPAVPVVPSAGIEPRASSPMLPHLPPISVPKLESAPSLPVVSPVLSDDTSTRPNVTPLPAPAIEPAPILPLDESAMLPTLPTLPSPSTLPTPSVGTPHADLQLSSELIDDVVAEGPEERRHPMAHLMPEITKPSEAALRAAELRTARKRKARRTKIIAGVVFVIVAAVAGPPVVKWTVDAINESGSTQREQPADSVPGTTVSPIDALLTTPPTSVAGSVTAP